MYTEILTKIEDTLKTVKPIKAIYAYPVTNIEQYPAAIFFPDAFQNSFESTKDNFKVYRFHLYVVVGATQKDRVDIFSTILPKTVDAVVQAFDTAWNTGTINGHASWLLVNSGLWSMAVTQNGLEATAELSIEVKMTTGV
jgi:hypothetical protein